jgi:glutamate synthase (NADPH/NADH) large chain
MAFVYDTAADFEIRVNPDAVVWQRIEAGHWEDECRELIAAHVGETQSRWADRILRNWDNEKKRFWQVIPKEMLNRLEHPVSAAAEAAKTA